MDVFKSFSQVFNIFWGEKKVPKAPLRMYLQKFRSGLLIFLIDLFLALENFSAHLDRIFNIFRQYL